MSRKNTYVAIIDDHVLLRNGLAALINSFEGYRVVFEADNGLDLIEKMKNAAPDETPQVVLMDISMPGMDGIQATAWMQKNYPDIKIVVLTMMDADYSIIMMIKAGAHAYVVKDSKPLAFKKVLDEVIERGIYYPDEFKDKIIQALRESAKETPAKNKYIEIWESLTKQEQDFVKLSATDLTYAQIARQMKITTSIVEGMRQSMFTKFNVKTRVGLALMAQRYNFLDTP